MDTWHPLGSKDELLARVPFAVKLDRHRIAVFHHDGAFRAIADGCNHRGGPLCEGRLRGEFVMCPWHGWEYSVITGRGPEGFDEEQVPGVRRRGARRTGSGVKTPPRHAAQAAQAQAVPPARGAPQAAGRAAARARPLDHGDGRGESALLHQRRAAGARDSPCRRARAAPRPESCGCATWISGSARGTTRRRAHACTWPCAITERDPADQLTEVYEGLVHWADVVLLSTPIRWGAASVALLQDGRAAQLRPEPDHHPQPGADPQQGRRVHHHRRPGQRAGGRGRSAHLLVGAGLRVSPVPVHRAFAGLGRRGHAEQRPPGAHERAAAGGGARAARPGARPLARARPTPSRRRSADGARGAEGEPARPPGGGHAHERPDAGGEGLRGRAVRRPDGRGRPLHDRRRRVLGGGT